MEESSNSAGVGVAAGSAGEAIAKHTLIRKEVQGLYDAVQRGADRDEIMLRLNVIQGIFAREETVQDPFSKLVLDVIKSLIATEANRAADADKTMQESLDKILDALNGMPSRRSALDLLGVTVVVDIAKGCFGYFLPDAAWVKFCQNIVTYPVALFLAVLILPVVNAMKVYKHLRTLMGLG